MKLLGFFKKLPLLTRSLLLMQSVFLLAFAAKPNIFVSPSPFGLIVQLLLTLVSLWVLGEFIHCVEPRRFWPRLSLHISVVIFYALLCLYHLRTTSSLDFSLVRFGIPLLRYRESFKVVWGTFEWTDLWILLAVGSLFVFLSMKGRLRSVESQSNRRTRVICLALGYAGITLLPVENFDEGGRFVKSVWHEWFLRKTPTETKRDAGFSAMYPYVKVNEDHVRHLLKTN